MMMGMPKNVAYQENVPAKPRSTEPRTSPEVSATMVGYTRANAMAMALNSLMRNFLAALYASTTGRK